MQEDHSTPQEKCKASWVPLKTSSLLRQGRPTLLDLGQARSIGLDEEVDIQRDLAASQMDRSLARETGKS